MGSRWPSLLWHPKSLWSISFLYRAVLSSELSGFGRISMRINDSPFDWALWLDMQLQR